MHSNCHLAAVFAIVGFPAMRYQDDRVVVLETEERRDITAEIIALVVSVVVLSFGVIRSIQSHMSRRKKERLDNYFNLYLELKEEKPDDYSDRLYELLNRSIKQMEAKNLDKHDFDIFARLIYAELSSLV